jgi:GntR family transcriptional regulator
MADHEPAYRRILGELRSRILSGDLPPGAKLPSVRELAHQYGVPNGTVARAVAELRAEGRVISRHGAGVYVREFREIRRSSPSRLARDRWVRGLPIQDADTGDRPRAVDVEVGEQPAPDWVALALGIEPGSPVAFRSRRFVVDERFVQLATSYLPADLARGTAIMHTNPGSGGIYARLTELGHAPVTFFEELRCRMPLPQETDRLQLPDGTPVIEITRHAFQVDGRCVEVNHMILDATAYVLDYTFNTETPAPSSNTIDS